jgi:hypothetical protein
MMTSTQAKKIPSLLVKGSDIIPEWFTLPPAQAEQKRNFFRWLFS